MQVSVSCKWPIRFEYCTWENFGVGKIDEFGKWNPVCQFCTLQLLIIISCSYTSSLFTNILSHQISFNIRYPYFVLTTHVYTYCVA